MIVKLLITRGNTTLIPKEATQEKGKENNIIENAQRHFQGSLFGCFEYVPYTVLTIVLIIKTINVRLD